MPNPNELARMEEELEHLRSENARLRGTVQAQNAILEHVQQQQGNYVYLYDLCVALGWQGGTIHQVLDEVKRLKALEDLENKSYTFAREILDELKGDV